MMLDHEQGIAGVAIQNRAKFEVADQGTDLFSEYQRKSDGDEGRGKSASASPQHRARHGKQRESSNGEHRQCRGDGKHSESAAVDAKMGFDPIDEVTVRRL